MASSVLQAIVGKGYEHKEVPSQVGKKFIVTGGTNGIGLSIARTLYSHGADVLIMGSQLETASAAESYIKTGDLDQAPHDYKAGFGSMHDASGEGGTESGEVKSKVVDFKDLKAVARVAKELAGKYDRLDAFLGIAGLGVNKYTQTDDGFDAHLTINNLAHMVLLSHLLPILERTSSSSPTSDVRIVLMSSELHRTTFGGPDPNWGGNKFRTIEEFKKDVGQQNLYARSKVAVILEAKALIQRYLQTSRILCFTTHPGGVATGQTGQYEEAYGETVGKIIQTVVRPIMKTPNDGALSALWAATAPEARDPKYPQGSYFTNPAQPSEATEEGDDQELVDNFWNNGLEVIKQVAGQDALGPFKA
ncbi:hypothetical protein JCM10207_003257 [Rhodosporidiobolus poonsookiae]